MYVCVTNGSWSGHSGVVSDNTNDTQRWKNIGIELKIILNLGYHLFLMFLNLTTSPNSLKRNTSLYSVWGTFSLSYRNTTNVKSRYWRQFGGFFISATFVKIRCFSLVFAPFKLRFLAIPLWHSLLFSHQDSILQNVTLWNCLPPP